MYVPHVKLRVLTSNTNKTSKTAQRFWRRCDRHPALGALLEKAFNDGATGRILFVASSELFPTWERDSGPIRQQIQSKGLPYLSHGVSAMARGYQVVATAQAEFQHQKQRTAMNLTQGVQSALGDEFRDQFVLAVLKTIQNNQGLRCLVNESSQITKGALRSIVKDYSQIDTSEFEALLDHFPGFLSRPKQRKAINRIAINLNAVADGLEEDPIQRELAWATIQKFIPLLRARRVSETQWRNLVVLLVSSKLVDPVGALYLWCARCPGVGLSISPTPAAFRLPSLCPSCGKAAQTAAIFAPTGLLAEAMGSTDGLLGAAVGWFLRKRKISFESALQIDGEECDFLVRKRTREAVLVECKMHHVMSPARNIRAKLLESRIQLRDHIIKASKMGFNLQGAVCVVNLSASQLRLVEKDLPKETNAEFGRVKARLMSYEHFPRWVEKCLMVTVE